MIKLPELLQDAEYELRNWGQAYASESDAIVVKKLKMICDKLQIIRHAIGAQRTWE